MNFDLRNVGWVKNFINPYNIETARIAKAKICFRNRHSFTRSLFFKWVVYFRLQSEVISVCCISHWMYTFFWARGTERWDFYYRILGFLGITIYYLKFQFRFVVSKLRNFLYVQFSRVFFILTNFPFARCFVLNDTRQGVTLKFAIVWDFWN